jgi:hypothetical protein
MSKHILEMIKSNDGLLTLNHFDKAGQDAIAKMVSGGKVEVLPTGRIKASAPKPTTQKATTTTKAPKVTTDTLVSVRIGSDQYAGAVLAVTDATVTVAYGSSGKQMTFYPSKGKWRYSDDYRLVIGESETELDRSF